MSEGWFAVAPMKMGYTRLFGEDKHGNFIDIVLTPEQNEALEDMRDKHDAEENLLLRSFVQ